MYDGVQPLAAAEATALKPARFKVVAARFLKDTTLPSTLGEVGMTIEVTLSPDVERAGWDDWIGVLYRGSLIGWVGADGQVTRSQLRAIRGHGHEVITTAEVVDFQGARTLSVQVPKTTALASWLEWRRPGF